MKKTLEQRLYEAARAGSGIRLSYDDVFNLVVKDDAIGSRITNAACTEAGIPEAGADTCGDYSRTWVEFVSLLKRSYNGNQSPSESEAAK